MSIIPSKPSIQYLIKIRGIWNIDLVGNLIISIIHTQLKKKEEEMLREVSSRPHYHIEKGIT